jgi:hypothetical protein
VLLLSVQPRSVLLPRALITRQVTTRHGRQPADTIPTRPATNGVPIGVPGR